MLFFSLPELRIPIVALFAIAVVPLVSAELRQGPTGVEYVKRFAPSTGVAGECFYTCAPTYEVNGQTLSLQGRPEGVVYTYPGGTTTDCIYRTSTVTYYCNYSSQNNLNGFLSGQGGSGQFSNNCPLVPIKSPGCDASVPVTVNRRELSPLEQRIKSRQYDPKRRSAGRRSSAAAV